MCAGCYARIKSIFGTGMEGTTEHTQSENKVNPRAYRTHNPNSDRYFSEKYCELEGKNDDDEDEEKP